jgi:hypothetical protein
MDIYTKKLIQIQNYIQEAIVCNEKGLARLDYMMANKLLEELSIEMHTRIVALESVGEQPVEIFRT